MHRLGLGWTADPRGFAVVERYNEWKAIDAVLRRIEAREQPSRRDDGRSPDDLRDPRHALKHVFKRLTYARPDRGKEGAEALQS